MSSRGQRQADDNDDDKALEMRERVTSDDIFNANEKSVLSC